MIRIRPLASSSAGNAYLVDDGRTKLLLECGIRYKDLQKAVGFQVSSITGCLLSHEHGDHSKAAKDLMKAGVDIYASRGTLSALGLTGHRAIPLQLKEAVVIGSWTVLPFDVEHDTEEPFGFLLTNKLEEKLVFITDSYYCKYRFSGLTHIMVEANFSLEILNENIAAGRVPPVMKKRLLRSHFSLEHMLDFLRANDLSEVQEIHLLHLSDNNSDETEFKRRVQAETGKPVYVAGR